MNVPRGTSDILSPRPVQFHPLCRLGRFGINKLGDNLWRVVFAPSRMKIVGGVWPDGKAEYRFCSMYRAKGWILERWLSASDYCEMGPERWEFEYRDPATGLLLQGPYPDRGEYAMCWDFENNDPTQSYACRAIAMINAGRLASNNERKLAIKEAMELEEKQRQAKLEAQIRDFMPSFHGQILSGPNGAKRGFKTRAEIGAKDLRLRGRRLPQEPRKFVTA